MRPFPTVMLLVGLCLVAGSAPGDSYMDARRLAREGRILSLEQIVERIQQIQPGQILEVEFDVDHQRMIYELEILDVRGTVWELKVDAVTGEIIEQELED
jgi:uncharacterized membrane protein YkoI